MAPSTKEAVKATTMEFHFEAPDGLEEQKYLFKNSSLKFRHESLDCFAVHLEQVLSTIKLFNVIIGLPEKHAVHCKENMKILRMKCLYRNAKKGNEKLIESSPENDHLVDWSTEKDCRWQLTFRPPVWKTCMAFPQVVQKSFANNSPSQDSNHPEDHCQ